MSHNLPHYILIKPKLKEKKFTVVLNDIPTNFTKQNEPQRFCIIKNQIQTLTGRKE